MFQAPQMSDYPDTAEGWEEYYADANAFYDFELNMKSWVDVAAGEEFDAYAESLVA